MNKKIAIMMILSILIGGCNSNTNTFTQEKGVQPIYEQVMENDIILDEWIKTENFAYENGKVGIINEKGELVVDVIYETIFVTNSGEYLGRKEKGYDLIRNHEVVPEFQKVLDILENNYDSYIFDLTIGLWRVRKDGKRSFLDMNGKQLTTEMFEFVSGLAIDGEGPSSHVENVFVAYKQKNNKYYCAVYNLEGKQITPFDMLASEYDGVYYCSPVSPIQMNSVAYAVSVGTDKGSFIYDLNGKILLENVYRVETGWEKDCAIRYEKEIGESVESYCLSPQEIGEDFAQEQYDYWESKDKETSTKTFDNEYKMDANKTTWCGRLNIENLGEVLFYVAEKDGKYALMLETGELLTEYEFSEIGKLSDYGFLFVKKDGLYAVMNYRGEMVTEYVYDFSKLPDMPFEIIGEWIGYYIDDVNKADPYGVMYYLREHEPDADKIPDSNKKP